MRPINDVHLKKFYEVLVELNKIFPLNMENIRSVIEVKGKKQFPSKEKAAIVLAVTDDIRDQCKPYVPVVSVTSAPNHLSEHVGILEVKIMDSKTNKDGGLNFIAWLSIFPSGRMVFEMDGVFLDSNGKRIVIENSTALRTHKFFNDGNHIPKLRMAMLDVFKSEERLALEAKSKLQSILQQPLPENN